MKLRKLRNCCRWVVLFFIDRLLCLFRLTNLFLRSWCARDFLNWVCILLSYVIIFAVFHLYEAFWVVILCHLYICCSQSSRLPGSAGGLGFWTVVPFHFYEHASMGKWSGFMLYLVNIKAYLC